MKQEMWGEEHYLGRSEMWFGNRQIWLLASTNSHWQVTKSHSPVTESTKLLASN